MKAIYNHISKNLPVYIGVVLIVANGLIDAGVIVLPVNAELVINAVLSAAGFGVLHIRQQASLK